MRFLLLAAIALAVPLSAQTSLRVVDPVLSVDGRLVQTAGSPLVQDPFGVLTIGVPGQGIYTVSERPFAGARRAGQFDGRGLYFAAQGRSVRMISREPILSLDGPVSAYVAFAPSSSRARGMAQLAIADGVDGRGRRSVQPRTDPTPPASAGPRPQLDDRPAARYVERTAPPASADPRPRLDDRPAARYVARTDDSELRRLRRELDRIITDRERLAQERDHLARQRDEALAARDRYAGMAGRARRDLSPRDEVDVLTAERDQLARERDRLALERDQLTAANAQGEAERRRLADEFSALRQRSEDAEARADRARRTRSDLTRVAQEVDDLRVERDRLRGEIQDRDRSLALLRDEIADRDARMPSVSSELVRVREQLADAIAARDRALAARDAAYAQRDAATRDLGQSRTEAEGLRAERDALRVEVADLRSGAATPFPTDQSSLDAERAALRRDRALLNADRAALAAERDAFEAMRNGEPADAQTLAERQTLLDQLTDAQAQREALAAERDALRAERDALAMDRDRLTRQLGEARARPGVSPAPPVTVAPATPSPPSPPVTIRTQPVGQDGAVAFLPGFDFARIQNPDVIRRRLDEATYPRWATVGRIEGDVLVLLQTDRTGRVVRTAVPTPIGGGLDGLAEEIVREMRFQPTAEGVRSQVVVRFEL